MSQHATLEPKKEQPFANAKKAPAATPPTPTTAADATVTPDATKPGAKRDVDWAKPWADEVDGVPTGAVARVDDDRQIVQTVTNAPKTSYSNDKKKYGPGFAAQTHTVDHERSEVTIDGDKKSTKSNKTSGSGNWKKKEASIGHTRSTEDVIGEGDSAISVAKAKSGSVDISAKGAAANLGKEITVKSGENYNTTGQNVKAGWNDGHIVAEISRKKGSGTAHLGKESENTYGIADGKLNIGKKNTTEYKRKVVENGEEVEKKHSKTNSVDFGIGPNGEVSANAGHSTKSENGTTRAIKGGVTSDGKGNTSGELGYTRGDKHGNSFSVNAKAGTFVECSEPKQVGNEWVVEYRRGSQVGGGVGGSHKGMGANASASSETYKLGSRAFKTKEEALEFKEHAAMRIQKESPDPNTIAGVMSMAIGETVGEGEGSAKALGATASFEGASLSVSGSKSSSDETTVRRVSANIFEVTRKFADKSGKDLGLSGNGIGLNRGNSESGGSAMTFRFDMATPEGQNAYQLYFKTGLPPMFGAKLVSEEESKGQESHQGVSVFGLLNDVYQQRSWESTVKDEKGKHEEYGGGRSHNVSTGRIGRWLGDQNISEDVSLVARQEDDKTDGFSIVGQYGGESGKNNRKMMARLSGDYADEGTKSDKSSGNWKVSTDVDAEAADKAMASIPSLEKYKNADPDVKMRAMAAYMREHGEGTAGVIEGFGDTTHGWDVELEGDKNFPGKAGREEMEAKTKAYAELMKISMGSPEVIVGQLQSEISQLEARKRAILDDKAYPDLPAKLRQQQRSLIEEQIRQLQAIRHPGLVEMSKNSVGEDQSAILMRANDEHAYDEMAPGPEKELYKLRDQITVVDGQLAAYERDNMQARRALAYATENYTDEKAARQAGPDNRREVKDKLEHGRIVDDIHRGKSIGEIDDLRAEFLLNQAQPQTALMYGRSLLEKLRAQQAECQRAATLLEDSARVQAKLNTSKATSGKFASYWSGINEMNTDDEYELPVYVDPYARPQVSLTLP
jgi:hypothetical protein